MTQKPPPPQPPVPEPEQAGAPAPREDELESLATEDETETSPDPYDDLWDPDMDTRPERIKRTKARPKLDARSRGRASPRGKRREEA